MLRLAPADRFPPVALPDAAGTMVPLRRVWAEGLGLLVFGHGDCGTTRLALPYVERLNRRRGKGAGVLAVLQEDADGARSLLEELAPTLRTVLDHDPYPLSEQVGLATVPTLVLVGADGVVARVSEGFSRADLEELGAALGVAPPLFAPEDTAPSLRPG